MKTNLREISTDTRENNNCSDSKYKCTEETPESYIAANLNKFNNLDVLLNKQLSIEFINKHFWYFSENMDILLRKYTLPEKVIVNNLKYIKCIGGAMEDILITQQISEKLIRREFSKIKYITNIIRYQLDLSVEFLNRASKYIDDVMICERIDNILMSFSNARNEDERNACMSAIFDIIIVFGHKYNSAIEDIEINLIDELNKLEL